MPLRTMIFHQNTKTIKSFTYDWLTDNWSTGLHKKNPLFLSYSCLFFLFASYGFVPRSIRLLRSQHLQQYTNLTDYKTYIKPIIISWLTFFNAFLHNILVSLVHCNMQRCVVVLVLSFQHLFVKVKRRMVWICNYTYVVWKKSLTHHVCLVDVYIPCVQYARENMPFSLWAIRPQKDWSQLHVHTFSPAMAFVRQSVDVSLLRSWDSSHFLGVISCCQNSERCSSFACAWRIKPPGL